MEIYDVVSDYIGFYNTIKRTIIITISIITIIVIIIIIHYNINQTDEET